jgi:hypothetical protein
MKMNELNLDGLEMERQTKRYWAQIRRECEAILRALDDELKSLREVESGWYEIFNPPHEKPKKTAGRVCVDCGAPLPDRPTGRPLLRCPSCLRKWRRAYQHMKYLERK